MFSALRLKSIRARLVGWLLLASLVPIVLTAYVVLSGLEEQVGRAASQRMDDVAQERERDLHAWIEQLLNDGRVFAALPATSDCLQTLAKVLDKPDPQRDDYHRKDRECIASLNYAGLSFLYDVMLLDTAGRVVFSVQQETPAGQQILAAPLMDTRLAHGVRRALQGNVAAFVPHEMYPPSGIETAFVVVPIVRDAQTIGALVLQLNNRDMLALLESALADTHSGELMLLRRESTDSALVLTPPRGHPERAFKQRYQLEGARGVTLQAALAGPAGHGPAIGDHGEAVFAAWRPLPEFGWGLVARITADEALAPVQAIRLALLPLVAGLLLATTALALLLGWRLVRPLKLFTAFSRELAAGQLGHQVGYAGHDELGELASTLNQMSTRLADSNASLQRAKAMLEVRVAERTAELTAKARSLEEAERVANLGHWETDWVSGARYWSPQVYRLLQMRPGIPDPVAFQQRIHPADRERVAVEMARSVSTGTRFSLEFRVTLDEGHERWLREEGETTLGADGKPAKSVGMLLDITERQEAELALRRSEANARSVLEAAQEGIVIISRARRTILYANPAAERMFGRTSQEMLGQTIAMLYPESARARIEAEFATLVRSQGGRATNLPAMRSDGTPFVVDVFASEIRYADQPAMFGFFTDVTELRAAEAERARLEQELVESRARRAEARAEAILDTVEEGVIEVDGDEGLVVYANKAALSSLGVELDALLGRPPRDLLPLADADADWPLTRVLRTGEPVSGEGVAVRRQDGTEMRVAYYIRPLDAAAGVGAVLVFRDVTERERQQLRLQLMSSAVEQSASAVIITDRSGHIEYVNPKFCELYGYVPAEVIGHTPRVLKSGHTTAAEYQGLWRAVLDGGEWHGEFMNLRKDGQGRWVAAAIASLRDADGKPTHFIGIHEDITERKAIEDELMQAREVAETAARAKSEFLARMSHEIRTPMNAIIGLSDLALQGTMPPRERDFVTKVNRSAQSLLGIINDVLDFSRIEAGKLELETVEFALDDVLQHLADLVHTRLHEGVELFFDTPPEVPARLVGDPLRLGQVLVNLCGNATKFTRSGSISVRVSSVATTPGSVTLRFEIEDTGDGIPADRLPHLFDAFAQAEASIARRFGGSGLGLAICRQLVQLMGGEISVRSAPGEGSTFSFTARLGRAGTTHEFALAPSLVGHRLLLVAMPGGATEVLRLRCVELGLDVWHAASLGDMAVVLDEAQHAGAPYQAIVVDCAMPVGDLHGWRNASRVPVLALSGGTGIAECEARLASIGLVVSGHLDRPVTRAALQHALMRALNGSDSGSSGATPAAAPRPAHALAGARVLVVDDAELNLEVAREYLQSIGVQVSTASDGALALDVLARESFDAVLMDCQMPVMDGYAATRELRSRPGFEHLPVIALTANALTGERERVLAAGMSDFISKPVDPERLFDTLSRWIAPKAPATAASVAPATPVATATPEGVPVLPGVDLDVGLARAMNKPATYRKYLGIFRKTHVSFASNFASAVAAGDAALAQRLAHTLKSGAASIGAFGVESAALALETALREGCEDARRDALYATLCERLDPLLVALDAAGV
ncbi:hypothetical protein GCM10025771_07390 [Niveibacterium umoris]|uniref:Virulence sensor protein BvgS n=1 Tax=Niveibacterium umoris TaxID=1193620 RepID=A0A840BMH0_9RHOO|nr:PAS domain S-box protein [Niveibacterium umoris]MBB4013714.1 PAS domain S-box-containing protein [Niveibacterium umoris]